MFELANEPIKILGPDGTYGSGTQGHFDNLKTYFQAIVDTIRASTDNILWIPGLGWQSQYSGYAINQSKEKILVMPFTFTRDGLTAETDTSPSREDGTNRFGRWPTLPRLW